MHTSKIGSWALLGTMSFVLVATVKAQEGRLYHAPHADVDENADRDNDNDNVAV